IEIRAAAREAVDSADFGPRPARKVFISYAREDFARVTSICEELALAGVPIWQDAQQLHGGSRWRAEIGTAIRSGAAFVAFFSRTSIQRERSYMREELVEAVEEYRLRRRDEPWLIPVRLDDC